MKQNIYRRCDARRTANDGFVDWQPVFSDRVAETERLPFLRAKLLPLVERPGGFLFSNQMYAVDLVTEQNQGLTSPGSNLRLMPVADSVGATKKFSAEGLPPVVPFFSETERRGEGGL